jgi:hypothetical protein
MKNVKIQIAIVLLYININNYLIKKPYMARRFNAP